MSFGRAYKPKDPQLDLEVGRIFAKFQGRITSDNLDMPEVCRAVGLEMRDGQLGVLERVIDGSHGVKGLLFTALSEAPNSPVAGLVVLCDRSTWDPLARGSGGPYLTWYNGSAWRALDSQ